MSYKAHFFTLTNQQLSKCSQLLTNKIHNQYVICNSYNGYADICQYNSMYDNLKFIMVKADNLNKDLEL